MLNCLANDKRAQRELVDHYGPYIYAYIAAYINDKDNAKDVLQDTFIAVFRALPAFRFDSGLYAWIRSIAQNNCYKYVQSKWKNQVQSVESFTAMDAVDDFNIVEALNEEEILKAIDTLEDGQRIVFLMHVVDGLKHAEIAEQIGITEEGSRSRLFKAKKCLQQKLMHYNN